MIGKLQAGEAVAMRAARVDEAPTALGEITVAVMHVQDRVAAVISEAREIANRTFGEFAEDGSDSAEPRAPQAQGAIGELARRVEVLGAYAEEAYREVSRLRRL